MLCLVYSSTIYNNVIKSKLFNIINLPKVCVGIYNKQNSKINET